MARGGRTKRASTAHRSVVQRLDMNLAPCAEMGEDEMPAGACKVLTLARTHACTSARAHTHAHTLSLSALSLTSACSTSDHACMSVCRLSVCLSVCLSVRPSVRLSVRLLSLCMIVRDSSGSWPRAVMQAAEREESMRSKVCLVAPRACCGRQILSKVSKSISRIPTR